MEYTKVNCPTNKYNIKCPYTMIPTGIVVHNTANDASAMSEISYMLGNNNTTSYHLAIDDYRAVQGISYNRNTWNAGDGINGNGNRNKISIEICYSKSGGPRYNQAENNAVEFIVGILKQYGWGIDRVSKHQDYSGKYCPHRILDNSWQNFINKIALKLNGTNPISVQPTNKYSAGGYQVNTTAGLNVRSGAGTSYNRVAYLTNGSKQGIDRTEGNWGHLMNNAGWICLDYCFRLQDNQPATNGYTPGSYQTNSSSGLNVRSGPGTNYNRVATIGNNSKQGIDRVQGSWGHLSNNIGWICLDYCIKI